MGEGDDSLGDALKKRVSRRQFGKLLAAAGAGVLFSQFAKKAGALTEVDPLFLDSPDYTEDGSTTLTNNITGDADTVDNKHADEIRTFPIVTPAVNLQAGESIQIARYNNPAGKLIYIWKAVVSTVSGGSDANLQLEVFNQTDAVTIYSTTNNTLQEGTPLASGGTGDEIEIRLNNNDASASFDAHALMVCSIED